MTNVRLLPAAASVDMPEPDWSGFADERLQERARETWRLTTQEMRDAGTLAPVNAGQLRRYVMAQVLYEDAAARVAAEGALRLGRTGKATYNLWFAILKDTDSMASAHEDKLGLNPRRRAQVTPAKRKQRAATAADGYLARSGNPG